MSDRNTINNQPAEFSTKPVSVEDAAQVSSKSYHMLEQQISQLQTDKDNVIQQAEIQAQEARTQKATVIEILSGLGLPLEDYNAISLVLDKFDQLQTEIESLRGERDKYKLRLSELCQLKAIKDKHGKTEEYNLRQPVAWRDAFTLLQEKKDE